MFCRLITVGGLALLLGVFGSAAAGKPRGAVQCADLNWSEEVLASNPDIALSCQGVYEKDRVLYAKVTIEVVRTQGNTLTFRPLQINGTLGTRRSITVDGNWRVILDGQEYRLGELIAGQRLNVYLPEDRFSLTVLDGDDAQPNAVGSEGD